MKHLWNVVMIFLRELFNYQRVSSKNKYWIRTNWGLSSTCAPSKWYFPSGWAWNFTSCHILFTCDFPLEALISYEQMSSPWATIVATNLDSCQQMTKSLFPLAANVAGTLLWLGLVVTGTWLEHDWIIFPFSWECHHPCWLIFFRGVGLNHQPDP